jgi:hypothetical protein
MPDDNDQSNPIDPLTGSELITLKQASELCSLNPNFLGELARKGKLKTRKVGRDWFTTPQAVEDYLKSRHRGKRTDLDKT